MFCKSIILNVSFFNLPCILRVLDNHNCEILKTNINGFKTRLCIRTSSQKLKVIATDNLKSIYKTLELNNKRCQNFFLNFSFSSAFSQTSQNLITLSDENYGFPISNALLKFNS